MNPAMLLGYGATVGALLIYGGMFVAGRAGAAAGLDGLDQTALRFLVTAAVLLPLLGAGMPGVFRRLGLWRCLLLAMLNGALYSAVMLGGLNFAPVSYGAAIVPGLQPFVVMVLIYLARGETPPRAALVGNLICVVGLSVVLASQAGAMQADDVIGIALFLFASAMWGGFAFCVRIWNVSGREALLLSGALSSLLFLPYYAVTRSWGALLFDTPLPALVLQLVYQGLLVGIVALLFYAYAISRIGGIRVVALSPALPLLATGLGALFLHEIPSPAQALGVAIVTAGLIVSQGGLVLAARRAGRTPAREGI